MGEIKQSQVKKYLYEDHKEKKDLLFQVTIKFILMSVNMILAWKMILLPMIKPSRVKIQLHCLML